MAAAGLAEAGGAGSWPSGASSRKARAHGWGDRAKRSGWRTPVDVRLNATLAPDLPGRTRVLRQSGALGIAISAARKRGLGRRRSSRATADLLGNDLLSTGTDPATDVVLLYLRFGNPASSPTSRAGSPAPSRSRRGRAGGTLARPTTTAHRRSPASGALRAGGVIRVEMPRSCSPLLPPTNRSRRSAVPWRQLSALGGSPMRCWGGNGARGGPARGARLP
jgi:hypothetical protein